LNGLYHEAILDTYNLERRTAANRVVQLDRDVASLISGNIPAHFHPPADADVNDYLDRVFTENAMFTVGLGISYDANLINRPFKTDGQPVAAVAIGYRAPDGPVFRPGRTIAQSLRTLFKYTGRFWVLVFAGKLENVADEMRLNCADKYSALCSFIDSAGSIFQTQRPSWDFFTLISGAGALQPSVALGTHPLGKTLYDFSGELFSRYGVDDNNGAIFVIRPDGIVSFKTTLHGGQQLSDYFTSFVRHRVRVENLKLPVMVEEGRASSSADGEVDVEDED
jgi:phenol 2-monooxygenase